MRNRVDLEKKLLQEIHYLPIEAIETMLKLVLLLKKDHHIKAKIQSDNFVEFIRNSPLMDTEIDLERGESLCRDVDL